MIVGTTCGCGGATTAGVESQLEIAQATRAITAIEPPAIPRVFGLRPCASSLPTAPATALPASCASPTRDPAADIVLPTEAAIPVTVAVKLLSSSNASSRPSSIGDAEIVGSILSVAVSFFLALGCGAGFGFDFGCAFILGAGFGFRAGFGFFFATGFDFVAGLSSVVATFDLGLNAESGASR